MKRIKISELRAKLPVGSMYQIEWPNFPEPGIRTVLKSTPARITGQKLNQNGPYSITVLPLIKVKAYECPTDPITYQLHDEVGYFATLTILKTGENK